MVLDPLGGSYFEEHGRQKKKWKWWDFSQHVHAPPFQSIHLKLNSNIDVHLLAQDQIYVTFSKEKKFTFNVGSKLLLKDPSNDKLLMGPEIDEEEYYLRFKHFQIYSLFANLQKSIRIPSGLQDRINSIEDFVLQLNKSIKYLRKRTRKWNQVNFTKKLPSEAMEAKDKELVIKYQERNSKEADGLSNDGTLLLRDKSHKDIGKDINIQSMKDPGRQPLIKTSKKKYQKA
ncbi:Hypothetical predicted protein [Pelobates cultripes]|uniref:FAM194 C-terminal domain-containing protein n=1 Tax=Pelobates cultripes TaxID=61616 RepID=A0AAD1R552_PELCU|nr:Hypothetical predicted protein [Pelobates cultripes]